MYNLILIKIIQKLVVKDIVCVAEGLGFDSQTGQGGRGVTNAATFLGSCVALALSSGGAPLFVARFDVILRV